MRSVLLIWKVEDTGRQYTKVWERVHPWCPDHVRGAQLPPATKLQKVVSAPSPRYCLSSVSLIISTHPSQQFTRISHRSFPQEDSSGSLWDYWSVALALVVMKVLERVVLRRPSCTTRGKLYSLQFAYQASRSVDDVVLFIIIFNPLAPTLTPSLCRLQLHREHHRSIDTLW